MNDIELVVGGMTCRRCVREVTSRLREVPGELRGYLTVVPESRWLKHADNLRFFIDETLDHYADHGADLEAILEAAASPAGS